MNYRATYYEDIWSPAVEGVANGDSIAEHLQAALNAQASDGDWSEKDEEMVVERYKHCNDETRDMVNSVLTALCGWSFATLAKNAGVDVTPYEKQERKWQVQTWE